MGIPYVKRTSMTIVYGKRMTPQPFKHFGNPNIKSFTLHHAMCTCTFYQSKSTKPPTRSPSNWLAELMGLLVVCVLVVNIGVVAVDVCVMGGGGEAT